MSLQLQMLSVGDKVKFGDSVKLLAAVSNAMRDELAEGERFITDYPPQSASSRYRRTGTLKRSWTSNMKSGGSKIEGTIGSSGNIAPYNEDVQGEDQEAIFKRIGWRTVDDLASKVQGEYPDRVQDAVNSAFK